MDQAVKDALRIARNPIKPRRFHQTLARRGYALGGTEELQELKTDDVNKSNENLNEGNASSDHLMSTPVLSSDQSSVPTLARVPEQAQMASLDRSVDRPASNASDFIQHQLNKDEQQLPQYEAREDFIPRVKQGIETIDKGASAVNNVLAKVAGSPEMRSPANRTAAEILHSALPQDPNEISKLAHQQWTQGNKLAAAETMLSMPQTGMFIGPKSKAANLETLDTARKMANENAPMLGDAGITSETGWHSAPVEMHMGAMGEQLPRSWWSEISDKPASSEIHSYLDDIYTEDPTGRAKAIKEGWSSTLGQVLQHPELYKHYPHLSEMPVHIEGMDAPIPEYGGFYSPKTKSITLSAERAYGDPEETKKTILHEIMHGIQHHEGAESGYNPRMGSVANPEYVRWHQQFKKDPELQEYHSLSEMPEYREQLHAAEEHFTKNYMPEISELRRTQMDLPRESQERQKISDQISTLIKKSNDETNEMFPLLARGQQLHESFLNRGVKIFPPKQQFLDPNDAYWLSRGENQARNVEYRSDFYPSELKQFHPEETMTAVPKGAPYSKQVFRRGNEAYDVENDAVKNALRLTKANRNR